MTRTRLTLLLLIGINLLLNSGCEKVVEKSVVEVKVVEENVVEIKIIEEKLVEESSLNFRNDKYYPVNSNTPYTGKIVTYYKNGQFEENRSYKDGKLDGVSKWYYENGQLEYSKNYKDGKLDGVFEEYDENGQLKESGSFKDGEKVGLWKMYNESGQLEDEKSRIARFFVTSYSELALTRYRLDVGNFPTTEQGLDALLKAPASKENLWRGPYTKESLIDPWGNPYQYRFPGSRNISGNRSFDFWSLGLDGVESGDDIGNWTNQ